jgi:hypothetical protein
MPLFGVAVVVQPTKKEREEGASERLVFGPEWEIGTDAQAVAMRLLLKAQREGKLDAANDPDFNRAQVLVCPFA